LKLCQPLDVNQSCICYFGAIEAQRIELGQPFEIFQPFVGDLGSP